MSSLAQAALGASIVVSAAGAVVLCIITVVYGFTPPSEEAPERATRRLFLTRAGHALAAACFAGTAILIAVALAQPVRGPAPTGVTSALTSRLDTLVERLGGVEERMKDSEKTLQRLETEVSDVADAQRGAAASVPSSEPPKALKPTSAAPSPARAVERPRAAAPAERLEVWREPARSGNRDQRVPTARVPEPAPATAASERGGKSGENPRPAPIATVAPAESSRAAGPTVTSSPPPSGAPPVLDRPPVEPPSSVAANPPSDRASTARPADGPAPSAGRAPASAPPRSREGVDKAPGSDFLSRLREDWRAIQRSVESGGEDLRRAVDRLRRVGD
jgi:hypothetical protein